MLCEMQSVLSMVIKIQIQIKVSYERGVHGVDGDRGDEVNNMIESRKLVCVPTEEEIREPI